MSPTPEQERDALVEIMGKLAARNLSEDMRNGVPVAAETQEAVRAVLHYRPEHPISLVVKRLPYPFETSGRA